MQLLRFLKSSSAISTWMKDASSLNGFTQNYYPLPPRLPIYGVVGDKQSKEGWNKGKLSGEAVKNTESVYYCLQPGKGRRRGRNNNSKKFKR